MNYSILDVAKQAGVSKSTVSRVLTGGSVSEKAQKAVAQAMEELNYYPNRMAQGLRGASTKVVGVQVTGDRLFLSQSMMARLAGISSMLSKEGYMILLVNKDYFPDEVPSVSIRLLQENRVDGLIFLGSIKDEADQKQLLEYRPIVYTGDRVEKDRGFRIYMGNYNYSRDMYSYLLASGHNHILSLFEYIHGTSVMERRLDAYRDVCQLFQVPYDENSWMLVNREEQEKIKAIESIYNRFIEGGFTAIFADDIDTASKVINYFSTKGLKLLDDYSIAAIERGGTQGYEDQLITSICLQDFEYGVQCGRLLLEVMADSELKYKDITIPYKLSIRKSVQNISNRTIGTV